MYVHIDKRWHRDIFDVFISDSVTRCCWEWERRCRGDSAAEWSHHQWTKCKNFFWRSRSSEWEKEWEKERLLVWVSFNVENSCISLLLSIREPINSSPFRIMYIFYFLSLPSLLFLSFSLCPGMNSFPMDVWGLFAKSYIQGWPWESGHDVSIWLRWRSNPRCAELGYDRLWQQSPFLHVNIPSHVLEYRLLSLSVRSGSGWQNGTW